MEEKLFDSFDMRDEHGKLTNAGALLADDSPIRHSHLFCTRWNGLDKSGGMVDCRFVKHIGQRTLLERVSGGAS